MSISKLVLMLVCLMSVTLAMGGVTARRVVTCGSRFVIVNRRLILCFARLLLESQGKSNLKWVSSISNAKV
jgi:hypothetical protein